MLKRLSKGGLPRPSGRSWVPFLVALAVFLGMAALYACGSRGVYSQIISAWGVDPFRFPFLDTDTVLSAVRCRRLGVDVYATNPCDALGRLYDYSPLWLELARFPIRLSLLPPIGFGLDIVFICGLLFLPTGRSWLSTAVLIFGILSPPVIFAVERGNNDLVIFLLGVATAILVGRSDRLRMLGYATAFLAGLLKYYPMALLATATRESAKIFVTIAAVAMILLAAFIIYERHELFRALALIPRMPYFVKDLFGAELLPGGLADIYGWSATGRAVVRIAMSLSAVAIACWIGSQQTLRSDLAQLTVRERDFLMVGCLLMLGCFFTAENIGYRAIHLVFVLPALIALLRIGKTRRLYGYGLIGTLALLWSLRWYRWLLAAEGAGTPSDNVVNYLSWFALQAIWWAVAIILASLLAGLLFESRMGSLVLDKTAVLPN